MENRRAEAQRDQAESAFTPMLRRVLHQVPAVLAAVFVDREGESIDYVSVIDPFEAKVGAAHMHHLLTQLRRPRLHQIAGEAVSFEIAAEDREFWVRQLGDEYLLVAITDVSVERAELRDAMTLASHEFRAEVGLTTPAWESAHNRLSVRVRPSPGWRFAPHGFSTGGVRVAISDVLGRWTEASDEGEEGLVCFRVRTQHGEELTLIHDPELQGWKVRG